MWDHFEATNITWAENFQMFQGCDGFVEMVVATSQLVKASI